MPVRTILRIGHPLLLQVADAVAEFNTPELDALVADMIETMEDAEGAGLAATQIGVMQRVVIFGFEDNPRYPDRSPIALTVLVNPEIQFLGEGIGKIRDEDIDADIEEDWEGCLSVPGMRGWVPRYKRIVYRGFDPQGNVIEREVDGFHARVVQHECDHLDGILYPQRIDDMTRFGYEEELFEQHPEVESSC
ncbi:MAG: peptide deformylase [Ectothiorhodospiraceae bacterium]|nr:peptide deformylase [Ectothiorhodospiraceae bacterium]